MTRRHLDALDYAINKIKKSPLLVYINDLILYGSCARGEEKFGSDVDLLLCLNEEARAYKELQRRVPFESLARMYIGYHTLSTEMS